MFNFTHGARVGLLAVRMHDLIVFPSTDPPKVLLTGWMRREQVAGSEGGPSIEFHIENAWLKVR